MPLSRREIFVLARKASKLYKPSNQTHRVFYRQLSTALRTLESHGAVTTVTSASRRRYGTDNVQGVQGAVAGVDAPAGDSMQIPEGIQGEDCANFKLWLQSCRNYGLHNCDEQLANIHEGRKTLAQVLEEQDQLIRQIAEDYKRKVQETDEVLRHDAAVQGIQGSYAEAVQLMSREDPCPQGVQGENCERFKLWLQNCGRFGFHNCDEQLENFKSGRKTLNDIFREQDDLIRSVAQHYRDSAATSGLESEVSRSANPNNGASQQTAPLTQRQKLKRAIKDYGSTVVVFHVAISLLSLGGFYLAVSSGLDVVGLLSRVGVGQQILESRLATGASTFVVAYAVHKVFAPVRIAATLTCTPVIVHRLRAVGFLKTPKA